MRVIVVGAGLGGCAVAVALREIGAEVSVFEAAPAMRREGESISLLANGTAALAALGFTELRGQRIARIRSLRRRDGLPLAVIDTAAIERRTGYPYVVVPRFEVLELLASRLDSCIAYGKRVEAVTQGPAGAEVHFTDGKTVEADLIVGADGSRSLVRAALWPADPGIRFSTAWQGTVQLPDDYPSPEEVFMVMGPGTVTLTLPTTGGRALFFIDDRTAPVGRNLGSGTGRLIERFGDWPGPLPSLLEAASDQRIRSDEVTIRRPPRNWSSGRVVLLGDAAHTLSPSIGQGTNQAFTDAVALADAAARLEDVVDIGAAYTASRRRRATAFWHASRLVLNPSLFPVMQLNPRLIPPSAGTTAWLRLTRPDRVVRRVLAAGGLSPGRQP